MQRFVTLLSVVTKIAVPPRYMYLGNQLLCLDNNYRYHDSAGAARGFHFSDFRYKYSITILFILCRYTDNQHVDNLAKSQFLLSFSLLSTLFLPLFL